MRLSTAACSLAANCGSASCTRNRGPVTLTDNDLCHASGVIPPNCCSNEVAALLTTMSIPPKVETVLCTRVFTCSRSPMWAAIAATRPGASTSSLLWAARHRSSDLPVTTTLAPAARCPWAKAKPIPRVPPVMIAVLPVRSNSSRSVSTFIARLNVHRRLLAWHAHSVGEGFAGSREDLGRRQHLGAVLERDRGRDVG